MRRWAENAATATESPPKARIPADLLPEMVTAIVDTREQAPLDLAPLRRVALAMFLVISWGAPAQTVDKQRSGGQDVGCVSPPFGVGRGDW